MFINATITLLIFVSTILSGNPKIVCYIASQYSVCAIKEVQTPKKCHSCVRKVVAPKPRSQSCSPKQESNDCNLSTVSTIKKSCKCFIIPQTQSAILSVQKPSLNLKSVTLFSKIFINTSNKYVHKNSQFVIPFGIHNTIESTILLL